MNKIILTVAAFLLLGLATIRAKSETIQDTNTVSSVELPALLIHLHPITTIYSMGSIFSEDASAALLYLTLEKPLNQSTSLIIRPNFWKFVRNYFIDDVIKVGSDFGIRYYLSEKGGYGELGDGYYLQGSAGTFLFRSPKIVGLQETDYRRETKNEFWIDFMFYVGRTWKFDKVTLSYDFGLGFNPTNNYNFGTSTFIGDLNFCIGIPISSKK
jgi:hypothetical protein